MEEFISSPSTTWKAAKIIMTLLRQFTDFSSKDDQDDVMIGEIIVGEQGLAGKEHGGPGVEGKIGRKGKAVDKIAVPLLDPVPREESALAEIVEGGSEDDADTE